jgi:hypothetical protein
MLEREFKKLPARVLHVRRSWRDGRVLLRVAQVATSDFGLQGRDGKAVSRQRGCTDNFVRCWAFCGFLGWPNW